ncbi:MAG: Hsp20/alpha crystallin family protein [Bacteroidetes bacterium]|jgi:HSP20 family protein|nr:Hsp20/alpha crystallin family protein [Bacteroidota bacterium]
MTLVKRFNYPFYTLFDSFFNDDIDRFNQSENKRFVPAVNVTEDEGQFNIDVVAPGYKKEDFKLKLEKDLLTISANQREVKEDKQGEKVIRKEYHSASFSRSFTLPQHIAAEKIAAKYEDGMLKISLPKIEPIQSGNGKEISVN